MSRKRKVLAVVLSALVVIAGWAVVRPALAADLDTCGDLKSFDTPSDVGDGQLTLVAGCAGHSAEFRGLANNDLDVLIEIKAHGTAWQQPYHETMKQLTDDFATAHAKGTKLSTFLHDSFQLRGATVPPVPPAPAADFDGKMVTSGSTLVVVVSSDEIQATGNWWQKMVATIGSMAIGLIVTAVCLAAVPAFPLIAPTCGAMGGFFGGLFGDLFNSMFDGRSLGSGAVWGEAIVQGLIGAVGGAVSGGILGFAETKGVKIVEFVRTYLRTSFHAWMVWLRAGANTMATLTTIDIELGELMPSVVRHLRDGLGAGNVALRVMPLGDSITAGVESSDGNGYRDELYDTLKGADGKVDFVGSQKTGTMADKDNEGHPGWRIDQIAEVASCTVKQLKPDLITLMAGTNDINQNRDLGSAPARLRDLITQLLADSPKAAVVVAKLLPTGKAGLQPRIDAYNPAIYKVVSDLRAQGKHVVWADTSNVKVGEGLQNDAHPDDGGYAKLGYDFATGVMDAIAKGWVQNPEAQTSGACKSKAQTDDGTTALGLGWRKLGKIAPGMSRTAVYDRTEFADMNGDGRQDYVQIRKDGSIRVGINTEGEPGKPTWPNWLGGTGEFLPSGTREGLPAGGGPTVAEQMRLADIDGDGRDDVIFVADDGRMDAYLNIALTDTSPPGWTKMTDFGPVNGVNRKNIRFADLNGDGRDDVLRVGDTGQVHAYFNNPGDPAVHGAKPNWVEKLSWAPGAKGASLANLRFADVNGDHKADYLTVGSDGSVHAYLNKGGKDAGGFEAHMFWSNASNYPGNLVQFQDISGDGRADYLVVYREGGVRAWLNRGGNL